MSKMISFKYKPVLIGLLIVAALIRFVVAANTSIEGRGDVLLFQFWGQSARVNGLTNVYTAPINHPTFGRVGLPNYLPPYLAVLWGLSHIHHFFAPTEDIGTPFASVIVKTPSIIADLLIIIFLAAIIRKRYGDRWALGVGTLYAFVPFTLIDGIIWGQIDSLNTFFMVLSVWAMTRKKFPQASLFFTIAFFIKLQSIVLLPLLVYEIIKYGKLRDIWHSVLIGAGTAFLLCAPFLLTGHAREVINIFTGNVGMYQIPSSFAFNFWWLFSGGYWTSRSDLQLFFGIPLIAWGGILFVAATAFVLWFRSRVQEEEGLWLTASFLAFAFFMLPTEMHERYLFPFFVLILPVIPQIRRARWLFCILAVTFTWNLIVVYLILAVERNHILGNFWGGSLSVAIINLVVFILAIWWYIQMARRKQII